jgi:Fe(3+) dicitrate transport protein
VPTRVRENSTDVILPGIGASIRPADSWRLFAGAHRGFAPPGPGADEQTKAESSMNYELGAALDLASSSGELVLFLNDYDNVLGEATLASGSGGTGDLFNGGAARVWGVEASARTELSSAGADLRVPLKFAYTYTNATFLTTFESAFEEWGSVEEGDRLPYLAPHQLFGSIGLETDDWSLDVSATYAAAMRTIAGRGSIPVGQGTDSFLVLSITGQRQVARVGTLFASAQNLTNQTYVVARRPAGARPGLPRVIELGVRLQN